MSVRAVKVFSFKVGRRYTCRLSLPAKFKAGTTMRATCEWSPAPPRSFTPEERAEFAAGRDAAIARVLSDGQHGVMLEFDAGSARLTAIEHERTEPGAP